MNIQQLILSNKKILVIFLVCCISSAFAQDRIHVPLNMLLLLKVPIQPTDTSWKNWNFIPNPKDSTLTIQIDRRVQGFPAFIPRNDAPFYNEKQRNEIRLGIEKILNPDGYFKDEMEYREFTQGFMERFVLVSR